MKISPKVNHSLRILGLTPGATVLEIRSAFRRLARTCHPDIAGKGGARRFEQIAGAYTYLKNLPPAELGSMPIVQPKGDRCDENKDSLEKWNWGELFEWRKRKAERRRMEEEARLQVERENESRAARTRELRIEAILAQFEEAIEQHRHRYDLELKNCDTRDFILRLSSALPNVRYMALSRLGERANVPEIFEALLVLLRNHFDDKTAHLFASLPLTPSNLNKITEVLLDKAPVLPHFLLTHLLRLHKPGECPREIWEKYLLSIPPSSAASVLRAWPRSFFLSDVTLLKLLEQQDDTVLVALLAAMKQRGIVCNAKQKEHLRALSTNAANPALRVWSKALLSGDVGQKA